MALYNLKGVLTRAVSFMLVAALLVSAAAVFGGTATVSANQDNVEDDPFSLIYNRNFEEGWSLTNGLSASAVNGHTIDKEETVEYTNNYFWRVTLVQEGALYNELGFDGHDKIGSILEFDIKVDDYCNIGRVMYLRSKGGAAAGTVMQLMYISDSKLSFFTANATPFELTNEWIHVAFVFDYTSENAREVTVTAYFDNAVAARSTLTVKENQSKGIDFVRIGNPGTNDSADFGDSFCIDNLQLYSGTNEFREITSDMGCGTGVNKDATITETIEGQVNPVLGVLDASLAMKIGVEYCYSDGERLPILTDENGNAYGAPQKINGKVMFSLERALLHTGYPMYVHEDGTSVDISTGEYTSNVIIGSTYAMVNGKRVELSVAPGFATGEGGNKFLVVAVEDFEKILPGWYVTYDDMGLLIVSPVKDLVNREQHLSNMTGIMKKFVFDYPTPEQVYEDAKEYTNNFDHPYILTNQAELDHLRDVYNAKVGDENYNPTMLKAMNSIISAADKYYKTYALPDKNGGYSEYVGFDVRETPIMPYQDSYGYDPDGGRLAEIEDYAGMLLNLGAAYQLTRDVKYVLVAYDLALAIGEWEHWGPGHILNTADTAAEFSMYYDWTYDANVELGLDVDKLAQIFYEKALYHSYRSSRGEPTLHYRPQGDASNYTDRTNNWNAVCTSGFAMAALALFDHEEYVEAGSFVISNNLYHLVNVGMEPYAPDGAYEEGTAYWGYATNVYFRLCMALDNATGGNYGLMDCWGIELTSYYACHTESSDFKCFNYNDSNESAQTTYFFYYVANVTNDPALAAIRTIQIQNGKNCTLYDILEYPESELAEVDLPLDYLADGLDLYTARSSWESGALFVGIIGGNNNQSHGQIDAGTFVYHNKGTVWFCDFGSDTYEVPGYWNHATRYRYYTMKAEGHNTIAISSSAQIPFGQVLSSISPVIDFASNEHGSYVLYDMTPALDSPVNSPVSLWNRGLMLTDDRQTVIIQDELYLANIHTVYWFAHFYNTIVKTTISDDGRTAFMTDKKGNTLRVSIVSKYSRFKFELMDCYTFIHTSERDGTYPPEYAKSAGVPEEDRSGYSKLAIKGEDVLSFSLAVVIEMNVVRDAEVPYEWTTMTNWTPSVYESSEVEEVGPTAIFRGTPKKSEVNTASAKISRYYGDGTAFATKFNDFYRSLTDLKYALDYYGESALGSLYYSGVDTLDIYGGEYDYYAEKVNTVINCSYGLTKSLVGF